MIKVIVNKKLCKGCELCTDACPLKIMVLGDVLNNNGYNYATQKDQDKCTGCMRCALMCPESAIEIYK
ncbi:MAG: 4Fe-4S binding protein [Eubacteriales bacterium]|nr:4Fe-4S binding protein [Eubacteriales bacterium]